MEKIFDLRFIVPPLITIFIVCIFVFIIDPIGFLNLLNYVKWLSLAFGGSASVLVLGFIISSTTTRLRNKFCLLPGEKEDDYDEKEQWILKQNFPWIGDIFSRIGGEDSEGNINCEIAEMEILNRERGYVQKYFEKTWNLAMASFNSCLAVILGWSISLSMSIIYLLLNGEYFILVYFVFFSIFLSLIFSVFFINGMKTLRKIYKINRALIRKLKRHER